LPVRDLDRSIRQNFGGKKSIWKKENARELSSFRGVTEMQAALIQFNSLLLAFVSSLLFFFFGIKRTVYVI